MHIEYVLGCGDGRLVTGDRLPGLAGDVMEIGPMAEEPGLQQRIGQLGVFIASQRFVPPAAGFVGAAHAVVGRPHPVIKFD